MERVVIAMSGGVDSATAAVMLKDSGHDLIGVCMRLWDSMESVDKDRSEANAPHDDAKDRQDVQAVAEWLEIPLHIIDLRREFESEIIRPFVDDYRSGRTPSPCVHCNARMKFETMIRVAEDVRAARVATGHYARIHYDHSSGRHQLLAALDRDKDQSYFLFELTQSQLARTLFPLGNLCKDAVRSMARSRGIPVAEKSESQELCFVPDGDYALFAERYAASRNGEVVAAMPGPGKIVDETGRILGKHGGIHRYTIGQRRGLGIAHAEPLYVLELRMEDNAVVVGERPRLYSQRCRVLHPNWISIERLIGPIRVSARIRSRHRAAPATIELLEDGSVDVLFDAPQAAITPGQACVFYQDDVVVGGGWIAKFSG